KSRHGRRHNTVVAAENRVSAGSLRRRDNPHNPKCRLPAPTLRIAADAARTEDTVMSPNILRFPVERTKSPARKLDEPAVIYYLPNKRIERAAEAAHAKGRR